MIEWIALIISCISFLVCLFCFFSRGEADEDLISELEDDINRVEQIAEELRMYQGDIMTKIDSILRPIVTRDRKNSPVEPQKTGVMHGSGYRKLY
jgi:hypothetical protein